MIDIRNFSAMNIHRALIDYALSYLASTLAGVTRNFAFLPGTIFCYLRKNMYTFEKRCFDTFATYHE